jgi:hypothetical protein
MLVRKEFTKMVSTAMAGIGLPAEAPVLFELPNTVFMSYKSDLSSVNENIDKVVYALTKWQSKTTSTGIKFPDVNITVTGKDYRSAEDNLNYLGLLNFWSDGLPLVPPTQDRVDWIMTGTELAPDYVMPGTGKIFPKGGIAAVKSMAIILAMAGGRPEYFPVLLSIVEAMCSNSPAEQNWDLSNMNSTTRSTFPAAIVNGTIGNQIRLSSGYGCLGPDPRHPAGGAIGRATHLILAILGGAVAGIGTMSNFGGMRFTNVVCAEDELGIPASWTTLGEDRGFKRGENVVTVEPIGNWYCENLSATSGGDTPEGTLLGMIPWLTARGATDRQDPSRSNGFIMFPDTFANLLNNAGWTKPQVKQFIYEKSLTTTGKNPLYQKGICLTWREAYAFNPEQVQLVIAGGAQAQHTYIMNSISKASSKVTKPIVLPKNWDALLAQAEVDLGPNVGHTD